MARYQGLFIARSRSLVAHLWYLIISFTCIVKIVYLTRNLIYLIHLTFLLSEIQLWKNIRAFFQKKKRFGSNRLFNNVLQYFHNILQYFYNIQVLQYLQ